MLDMIKCSTGGAYYARGEWVPADGNAPAAPAAKALMPLPLPRLSTGTMAYNIMQAHNTSGDAENLKIKFDAMASHDITFVGIIQTARASGLEKFPILMCLPTATTACAPWAAPSTRMTTASACPLPKSTVASLCRPIWRSSTSTCASALRAAAK